MTAIATRHASLKEPAIAPARNVLHGVNACVTDATCWCVSMPPAQLAAYPLDSGWELRVYAEECSCLLGLPGQPHLGIEDAAAHGGSKQLHAGA